MWNRTGGSERYARRRRWWANHHDQFAAALSNAHPLRYTHVAVLHPRDLARCAAEGAGAGAGRSVAPSRRIGRVAPEELSQNARADSSACLAHKCR